MLGFDELDFIGDLLSHRKILVTSLSEAQKRQVVLGGLMTKEERLEALRQQDIQHKNAPLAPQSTMSGQVYPHVYKSNEAGNTLSSYGRKFALPHGSVRQDHEKFEEHSIPAAKVGILAAGQKLIDVKSMDGLCRRTFTGYKALNRMQSLLYPVAYQTNENMLISAPTGAGKTDAAMLTVLNTIAKNITPHPTEVRDAEDFMVNTTAFKIVYVAPMKALAAEITEKFGKRLAWLGIEVREFTGDMHLTKAEISRTQIIVTTPEKWDVVTRRGTGDTELVQKVRLLIIDEVSCILPDHYYLT